MAQRVIATVGRLDRLNARGDIEGLVRSLAKYSEQVLLVLSGKSEAVAHATKIGPALIFERICEELGLKKVLCDLLEKRLFSFDVERAAFLTVLHRLIVSGSDRSCEKWRRDYTIRGVNDLSLHHFYRAMGFLGEELEDQIDATPFSPRCTKDHRGDLNQLVVGAVLDVRGRPICCEMWPGNTTDVKSLLPIAQRIRNRFQVARCCLVADRGMISKKTLEALDHPKTGFPYILGVRMRNVKEVREEVLLDTQEFREVTPEGKSSKDPSPLQVKEVGANGRRYIVCLNPKQARKDAADREAILASLEDQLKKGAKKLVGNRGFRRYLKTDKGAFSIDQEKINGRPSLTASGCSPRTPSLESTTWHSNTRSSGR